jgi:hypothetical protein
MIDRVLPSNSEAYTWELIFLGAYSYLFAFRTSLNLQESQLKILNVVKHIALDSDDLLYLKEQMEAEEDAERLRRRTEKRAFAAFKISFTTHYLYFGRLLFIFLSCDVTF